MRSARLKSQGHVGRPGMLRDVRERFSKERLERQRLRVAVRVEEPFAFDHQVGGAAPLESLQLRIEKILGVRDLGVAVLQRADQRAKRTFGFAELVDQLENQLRGGVAVVCV